MQVIGKEKGSQPLGYNDSLGLCEPRTASDMHLNGKGLGCSARCLFRLLTHVLPRVLLPRHSTSKGRPAWPSLSHAEFRSRSLADAVGKSKQTMDLELREPGLDIPVSSAES